MKLNNLTLRNVPLQNPKPRTDKDMEAYIEATSLKLTADSLGNVLRTHNGRSRDLDPSRDGVAIREDSIDLGYMGPGDVKGTASFDDNSQMTTMRTIVDDNPKGWDGKFTLTTEGDLKRYTYHNERTEVVDHLVHDTASDTISYFHRNAKGQFIKF